jgi:serine/threonine protein kinase
MRIKCPECEAFLSLGHPKPGSFRPKCKQCGKAFRLKVSDEDPPRVAVGKIRADAGSSKSPKPKSGPSLKSSTAATVANQPKRVEQATQVAATIDSAVAPPEAAVAPPEAASAPATVAMEATIESTTGSQLSAAQRTAGSAEPTVDGTLDGSGESVEDQGSTPSKIKVSAGGSSAKSGRRAVAKPLQADSDEIPERLGGYRIIRLLGRGAMGAVYEAQQLSLDRLVALKTIRSRLSRNPSSLARFTREAYAAAQLTHHNVVQIYDFGEDAGKHFFSMEWVRGGPLDELIKEKGALDPKLAAGYALQAARGLQFAHRNGMVHRDIKPANLLLSEEGVVKVADLGLVKIPDQIDPDAEGRAASTSGMESGTQMTMQGTAVGTPAYMAPEQGVDAAGVDHRADIYSLGCTLFYMLAGRAPFDGSEVSEILEQHAHQPLPNLVELNPRVPRSLQGIVERAMAKRPADRYPALTEMIVDLESLLGVSPEGEFSPTSEQADQWERIAFHYAASTKKLRLTRPLLAGLIGISGILTLAMPLVAGLGWGSFGPALLVAAIVTALVLGARGGGSPIVTSFRGWISSLSWMDYAIAAIGATVLVLVALITGMLPGLVAGGLLGAIAGVAYQFQMVGPSRRQCEPVVKDAERFVRDLRIDGADEDGVRSFAARYGGDHWQGLFEAVFGYEAFCKIRDQLRGDPSFPGSTAGRLRDKVCSQLAGKSKVNRESRDHKRLAKLEQCGLQSEGIGGAEARDRAWQMAAAVIDHAKADAPAKADPDVEAQAKRDRMKSMLAEARSGKYKTQRDKLAPIRCALGGQTRLLAGCILLAIFAVWGNNNGLFDSLKETIASGELDADMGSALRHDAAAANQAVVGTTSAWSIGLAGLLLAMSAFVSGWRMTPFAVAATIVILFGPALGIPGFGIPVAGQLQPWMLSGLAGAAIYVPGILFGEKKDF